MKLFIFFSAVFLLLFASSRVLGINAKINTSFSDVNTETYYTSALTDNSKATLSNDLKMSYEQTADNLTAPVGFLANYWDKILIALLGISEVVTRLIPSVKDNSILNFFLRVINAVIPNAKSGGGVF